MRKIETKDSKAKSDNIKKIALGIFMVIILIISTAGYAFYNTGEDSEDTDNKLTLNGVEFLRLENNYWYFSKNDNEFYTRYNPEETENITIPIVRLESYTGKNLYFASENSLAKSEIYQNMKFFIDKTQDVCFFENCTEDLPYKNCTDNIIIIKYSENIEISKEENCILINAPSSEILRASDAFIYKVLGV
ncbi:MAG: hypothetical protein ABIH72_03615 [archaeon]